VKDFVRKYGKIAAFFAAGAFLLSLLIGLVSRNPFGIALLRALLLALAFAGLGAGLRFVVTTYLPEIAGADGSAMEGGKPETKDGRGGRVDIVLPEERPPSRQRGRSGEGSSMEDSPLGVFSQGAEVDGDDAMPQADAEVMENLSEELEEELPGATEGREDALGGEGMSLGDDELTGTGGGFSSPDTGARARSGGGTERDDKTDKGGSRRGRRGSDADADSLPDISNLEILTDRGSGAPGARPGGAGEETPEDAVRGAVSGQDPALLARAIRTVLKRDEKG
jgi:hypothetical protein